MVTGPYPHLTALRTLVTVTVVLICLLAQLQSILTSLYITGAPSLVLLCSGAWHQGGSVRMDELMGRTRICLSPTGRAWCPGELCFCLCVVTLLPLTRRSTSLKLSLRLGVSDGRRGRLWLCKHVQSLQEWKPKLFSSALSSVVTQLLSCVQLFATSWTAARQASLSFTIPAQTRVHRVGDALQLSHPLSATSPPAFNLSQHQGQF